MPACRFRATPVPCISHRARTGARFHESLWRRKGDGASPVSREALMVALQNTTLVLIRATEATDTRRAE